MATEVKIIIDKNKSAEDYLNEALKFYIIPDLIKEKYPTIIKLIFEAESMDAEEREYWLQIMPIMDDEQAKKLMDILTNEKVQLKKINDAKSAEEKKERDLNQAAIDHERIAREKMQNLKNAENKSEAEEVNTENELLAELDNL